MNFMMASSNDDKSDICQFFFTKTYSVLSIQYMYKVSCKMDKHFLRYFMFSTTGLLAPPPPPQPWDFRKSPAQVGSKQKMFTSFKLSWKLKFTLSAPMSVLAWKALLKWYRPSNEPDCLLCNPLKLISTPD